MFRFTLIFSFVALLLPGCGKKTQAEIDELERQKIREQKRTMAIQQYKQLAEKYPDHEKARAAADKAKALEAQTKK